MVNGANVNTFLLTSAIGILAAITIATLIANRFKNSDYTKYERMKWFGIGGAFGVALMVVARILA